MVLARQVVGAVALAAAVAAGPRMQAQDQQKQQSQVPDAPRPQTLPTLNTVTPVGAALPQGPAVEAPPTVDAQTAAQAKANNGGVVPTNVLPKDAGATGSGQSDAATTGDTGPLPDGKTTYLLPTVHVNFVQIPFTVKDSKGQLFAGLTWRDVEVFENGQKKSFPYFSVDPVPLSVALVIDQSVDYQTMEKINSSLSALQGAFAPYDEVALYTYNNGVKKQTDFTAAQSPRLAFFLEQSKGKGREPDMNFHSGLDQTITKNGENVDPNTAPIVGHPNALSYPEKEYHTLNDAILAAAADTAHAGRGRRRIVYVISDGKEYGSHAKEKDVVKFLQANQIALYATLVGESGIPGMGFVDRIHLPLTMRDDALPRYAAATGGQCDPEYTPRSIENSFARIAEEVRTQYTVGYYSNESVFDGKFRSVEIRVLRPNLDVIAKKGYYPTASANLAPVPQTPMATP